MMNSRNKNASFGATFNCQTQHLAIVGIKADSKAQSEGSDILDFGLPLLETFMGISPELRRHHLTEVGS